MNIKEDLCARLREYFTICNIPFREHTWNGKPTFVYVYKKDKTGFSNSTKCAAIVYDGFLAIRHYDLLAYVYDEAGFAEYCLREQSGMGRMGFETVSGRVYYETTTLCIEEIPSVVVIELLNRCANKYLYERSGDFYHWTRIIDLCSPEGQFCGNLPESTLGVDPAPGNAWEKALDKTLKKDPVKRLMMRITGKRLGRFAVYTARLRIGNMRLLLPVKKLRLAFCRLLHNNYEKTPLTISLEGEEIFFKIRIVTDRAYTPPDETPFPVWVDMGNWHIKTQENGDWMSPLESVRRLSERVLR